MAELRRWVAHLKRVAGLSARATGNSLRENVSIGLLAVGIATALWLFVVAEENPRVTVDIAPAVRASAVNVPDGMAPLGPSEPISIRASAPRDVAEKLTSADFRATVDLSNLGLGVHETPVDVSHVGSGRGVRIVQVLPSRTSVTLQPLRTITVPVRAIIDRQPPVGFEAKEPITTDPATAQVSGPEELINRVAEAIVRLDLSQANDTVQTNVDLVATNGSGLVIDGVSINPGRARARVEISQTLFERSFAVIPQIKNNPASGYMISGIEVQPSVVVLQGVTSALDKLDAARTEEIDLSGAITDVSRTVRLDLPAGVRTKTALDQVQVRIRILPATGRAVFSVAPNLENVGDGLQARSQTGLIEIEVEGPVPQLRALLPNQLQASANLSGLGIGRHDVAVSARVPDGLRVISVRPDRIAVEVQRR